MIADGGAYRLADMMLSAGTIFPAFVDLLVNEAFSIRLGAMAAAEEIADRRLDLAVRLVEPLWDRFDGQADAVKGDIVYVMGLTGDQNALDILTNLISAGCSEDVNEAAEEAIAEIRSRL
jgi:HEAT repeat protein